jgi:hypothetical protein
LDFLRKKKMHGRLGGMMRAMTIQLHQQLLLMIPLILQFIWDNLLLKANVLKINNLLEFKKKFGLAWVLHQVMDEVDLLLFIQLPFKHLQLQA